jgi:hypothetical protein
MADVASCWMAAIAALADSGARDVSWELAESKALAA